MSHNKISFITRKTFPSNPYVPYKLREIDLSYNSMPVVTFDLVFGTSKLERLNLSHNVIADIRKGQFILNICTRCVTTCSYNIRYLYAEEPITVPLNCVRGALFNKNENNVFIPGPAHSCCQSINGLSIILFSYR